MAWYYDGSASYMSIASHSALTLGDDVDNTGAFTIAFWLKSLGMTGTGSHYLQSWGLVEPFFQLWTYGAAHATRPGRVAVYAKSGSTVSYYPEFDGWNDGNWHHLALVGTGTTLYTYHDGIACSTTASMATLDAIDQVSDLFIGARCDLNAASYYNGHLAEMAKWDRALSAGEIAALTAGASPARFRLLLAWYLSMRTDLRELIANLSLTNYGLTLTEHPRVELPPQTGILRPTIQRALGV